MPRVSEKGHVGPNCQNCLIAISHRLACSEGRWQRRRRFEVATHARCWQDLCPVATCLGRGLRCARVSVDDAPAARTTMRVARAHSEQKSCHHLHHRLHARTARTLYASTRRPRGRHCTIRFAKRYVSHHLLQMICVMCGQTTEQINAITVLQHVYSRIMNSTMRCI